MREGPALPLKDDWFVNSILVKDTCAPSTPPANQADTHILQGGSFAGEGMPYFPLALPNDKKIGLVNAQRG
jgi:hypothetical protein